MTMLKYHNDLGTPMPRSFSHLLDRFFNETVNNQGNLQSFTPNVDITETESGYELQVVAPGFQKENFQIEMHEGLLVERSELLGGNLLAGQKRMRLDDRRERPGVNERLGDRRRHARHRRQLRLGHLIEVGEAAANLGASQLGGCDERDDARRCGESVDRFHDVVPREGASCG